jgi:hypothetical protein
MVAYPWLEDSVPERTLPVNQTCACRGSTVIGAGASGYLLKATPADEILHAFESALDGGAAMEQIARRVLDMFATLITARTVYRSPPANEDPGAARGRPTMRLTSEPRQPFPRLVEPWLDAGAAGCGPAAADPNALRTAEQG